jgi:hypothetical protein
MSAAAKNSTPAKMSAATKADVAKYNALIAKAEVAKAKAEQARIAAILARAHADVARKRLAKLQKPAADEEECCDDCGEEYEDFRRPCQLCDKELCSDCAFGCGGPEDDPGYCCDRHICNDCEKKNPRWRCLKCSD